MNRQSITHAPEGEYKTITQEFSSLMEEQLRANEHKGQWREWRPEGEFGADQLLREIHHHKQKLSWAVNDVLRLRDSSGTGVAEELQEAKARVREHAADMGNFLMKAVEIFGK